MSALVPLLDALLTAGAVLVAPLVELSWKAGLVLAVAAVVDLLLRRSSAASRHLVWSVAIYVVLLLPLLSVILPERAVRISGPQPTASTAIDAARRDATGQESVVAVAVEGGKIAERPSRIVASQSSRPTPSLPWSLPALAVLGWAAGAVALLIRTLVEIAGLLWISSRTPTERDGEWSAQLQRCADRLGIRQRVRLKRGDLIPVPMTFGWVRPVVLLPGDSHTWPVERREAVLMHELAHVRRADALSNLAAHLARALFWHNPLTWLATSRLQVERERACDDCVLGEGASGCDYAGHLLAIAADLPRRGLARGAAIGMAQQSELKRRIQAILDDRVRRGRPSRLAAFVLTVVALVCTLPVAMTRITLEPAEAAVLGIKSRGLDTEATLATGLNAGNSEETRRLDTLVAMLDDPDARVRRDALRGLGRLADKRGFYAVIEHLDDPEPETRRTTVWALASIACDPSYIAIVKSLDDTDASVREMAARALGGFRPVDADRPLVEILRAYTRDAERIFRPYLGPVDDSTVRQHLTRALSDPSDPVRREAARALERLGEGPLTHISN